MLGPTRIPVNCQRVSCAVSFQSSATHAVLQGKGSNAWETASLRHCSKNCRQSKASGADADRPASNLPKSEPSGNANKQPQSQDGNALFPGTRMLFALRSMAKHMSPVLSTYVTPHKPAPQQRQGGNVDAQGGHPQMAACNLHCCLLQKQAIEE